MDHNALKSDKVVSYYSSVRDKNCSELSLETAFDLIKGGKYKSEISQIRTEQEKHRKDNLKNKLPAITPSGLFNAQRKKEFLKSYSGIICLDFDNVENLKESKNLISNDEYCLCVFISPSGNGLKVFVKVSGGIDKHLKNFNTLCKYFKEKYQLVADSKCSDVTRLMFLSYDEKLILKRASKQWSCIDFYKSVFDKIESEKNPQINFIEGKRNNFVFDLGRKCRDNNLPIDFVKNVVSQKYASQGFDISEIKSAIQSAYSWGTQDTTIPEISEKAKPFNLWDKVEEYVASKYELRNNVVSNRVEFRKADSSEEFIELNESSIYRELQKNGINISMTKLIALLNSDFVRKYNPIDDYFQSQTKWDEINEADYILKLTNYIPVKNKERFITQLKKMLVRCIACALEDNVFNKQVFVLVHDMQNSGKSTFCRWLCPPALSNYLTENVNTDKDSLIALASNFLINMDELATLSKAEINSLKSMISRDKINVRLPYGKRTTVMPRRANFIGSTNKDEFLTDETGSVRWLCFELTDKINFDYSKDIDINNIWRQAFTMYINGYPYQLTPSEIEENERENQKFQMISFELETIPEYFTPCSKEDSGLFVTTTTIFNKISVQHPIARITLNAVGKALKLLGFKQVNEYNKEKGFTVKGYYVKELK